jgi:glycosyltransferase involved in cell wall biosynthesis
VSLAVVIPAFNAERTIVSAIRSASDVACVERVIVVDDGSTDATAEIVARVAQTHSKVVQLSQDNAGTAVARLRGAEHSSEDHVIFLDADDMLIAEGVARLLRSFQGGRRSHAVIGGLAQYLSTDGQRRGSITRQGYSPVTLESVLEKRVAPWPPAASIVCRSIAVDVLRLLTADSARETYPEDYVFLVQILKNGYAVEFVDVPAALYRVSQGSKTAGLTSATLKEADAYARLIWGEVFGTKFPGTPLPAARIVNAQRAIIIDLVNGRWVGVCVRLIGLFVVDPRAVLSRLVVRLLTKVSILRRQIKRVFTRFLSPILPKSFRK